MSRPILPESSPVLRPPADAPGADPAPAHPTAAWRSLVILLIGILIGICYWLRPPLTLPPQAGVVMHLPSYVRAGSGFIGSTAQVSPEEHRILPKDTEFARKLYRDFPALDEIYCSIVLAGAMQQSIHRPEVCLVAQGWNIINQEYIPIQLESGHQLVVCNLTIRRVVQYREQAVTLTAYYMYWFVGEKITTPSHLQRAFLTSWDRIVHNRAHRWAYVTVSAPITGNLIPNGRSPEETKDLLVNFIKAIVPTFQKSEMEAAQP
jgi:hypothetical protein